MGTKARKWMVMVDGSAVSGKAFDAACAFINIQARFINFGHRIIP
jgi:hypothetical protein